EIRVRNEDELEPGDTDARYVQAFKEHDLDIDRQPIDRLARQLRARPRAIVRELIETLDDWSRQRRRHGAAGWQRLLDLARAVDHDPWRNDLRSRLRRPEVAPALLASWAGPTRPSWGLIVAGVEQGRRRAALLRLAQKANLDHLGPTSVLLLAGELHLEGAAGPAITLLRRAQRRHPGHVWLNHELGRLLHIGPFPMLDEAIRF